MVGPAPPPSSSTWQAGLYWLYVALLAMVSIFWLAIASPIIQTLRRTRQNIFFCIFAGIAIAEHRQAHAISDIAGIWRTGMTSRLSPRPHAASSAPARFFLTMCAAC